MHKIEIVKLKFKK